MCFFSKRGRFAGLLFCLGLLVMMAGCGSVKVAAHAPANLYGAWQTAPGDGPAYYLLFLVDGEYRVAAAADLLYDAPLFLGRYQYDAGRLTFINAGLDEQNCREPGQYVVAAYDNSETPQLTLARTADQCDQRHTVLTGADWDLSAADG